MKLTGRHKVRELRCFTGLTHDMVLTQVLRTTASVTRVFTRLLFIASSHEFAVNSSLLLVVNFTCLVRIRDASTNACLTQTMSCQEKIIPLLFSSIELRALTGMQQLVYLLIPDTVRHAYCLFGTSKPITEVR